MQSRPRVFVLMPFDQEFDAIFERLIRPAFEPDFVVERADTNLNQQSILRDIMEGIGVADLVVVDLSDLKPNVLYEVGVADTLGRPTILITQSLEGLPFDLFTYRSTEYSPHIAEADKLRSTLEQIKAKYLRGAVRFGSPVADFLPGTVTYAPPGGSPPERIQQYEAPPDEAAGAKGLLDFMAEIEAAAEELPQAMQSIACETESLGDDIKGHTERLQALSANPGQGTLGLMRQETNRVALRLDKYSAAIHPLVSDLEGGAARLMEGLLGMAAHLPSFRDDPDKAQEFKTSIVTLKDGAHGALENISGFREAFSPVLTISGELRRAGRSVMRTLERLGSVLLGVESGCARALELIAEPGASP